MSIGSVRAQSPRGDSQLFNLSAKVSNAPQLSRSEIISPYEIGAKPMPVAPAPALSFVPQSETAPVALVGAKSTPLEDDDPEGYLSERNVDWSHWIGTVADRWHYVLRLYEDGFDSHFVTQQAALIQFTCYSNGQIGGIMLRQSSGSPVYDRMQVLALMQAAPVPPFPVGTKRNSITLIQGWESHVQRPGERDYAPGSYGRDFPMEKVREWVMGR